MVELDVVDVFAGLLSALFWFVIPEPYSVQRAHNSEDVEITRGVVVAEGLSRAKPEESVTPEPVHANCCGVVFDEAERVFDVVVADVDPLLLGR